MVKDTITDLYDNNTTYELLKYATSVTNNNFTKNHAGTQGSAITMYLVSEIYILNNTFMENGPVTSFSEVQYSPYYKYFAMG